VSSLIILDLETTGLEPERGEILELAMIALEYGTLREIAAVSTCLSVSSGVWGRCDEKVYAMHITSGLKDDVWGPRSKLAFEHGGWPTPAQLEGPAVAWLQQVGGIKSPLGGYNPSFDRGWLKRHMPQLEMAFHYRSLDVNFCHVLREVITQAQGEKKNVTHRALDDCRHAAQALRNFLGANPG